MGNPKCVCVLGAGMKTSAALFAERGEVAVQIGRTRRSPSTQSSGESSSPVGRESGEKLDRPKLRNAKNLKDAVIATPFPPAGPWQVRPLPG